VAYPSTFQDIQNAVITKARLDATNDLAKVKDWINQTYAQVLVESGDLVTTTTINQVANTSSYTLPTAVSRIVQMVVTPAGLGSTFQQPPMKRTTLDDILSRRANGGITANGGDYSRYYALLGTKIEVWPTPAAADIITVWYSARPTVLSANGDLPIIDEPYASKLLEYGALVQAGDWKGDPATQDWQNDFDVWMGRYLAHLDEQQGDIPDQFRQWGSLTDTIGLYSGW
jgi:hypothetical protein